MDFIRLNASYPHNILLYLGAIYYNVLVFSECAFLRVIFNTEFVFVFSLDSRLRFRRKNFK